MARTEEERRKLRKAWLAKQRHSPAEAASSDARAPSSTSVAVPDFRSGTVRCTRVPVLAAQLDRAAELARHERVDDRQPEPAGLLHREPGREADAVVDDVDHELTVVSRASCTQTLPVVRPSTSR